MNVRAVHVGARLNGTCVSETMATEVAHTAEAALQEMRARLLALTEAELGKLVAEELMASRHPGWFKDHACLSQWASSIQGAVLDYLTYGRRPHVRRPQLQLIHGGARAEQNAGESQP